MESGILRGMSNSGQTGHDLIQKQNASLLFLTSTYVIPSSLYGFTLDGHILYIAL